MTRKGSQVRVLYGPLRIGHLAIVVTHAWMPHRIAQTLRVITESIVPLDDGAPSEYSTRHLCALRSQPMGRWHGAGGGHLRPMFEAQGPPATIQASHYLALGTRVVGL